MYKFEWDEHKSESNAEKHGINFERAKAVFQDKDRIQYTKTKNNERRYIAVGKVVKVILTLVYTLRKGAIRIISARQSRRSEIRDYLENKFKQREEDGDKN